MSTLGQHAARLGRPLVCRAHAVAPAAVESAHYATKRPQRPSSPLFGWASALGLAALLLASVFASAADAGALYFAAVLELAAGLVLVAHVVRIGHLVFATRGAGHYAFTAWRLVDAVVGNALAHVCFSLALWTLGAARGFYGVYSHTDAVSAWYALYDLALYALVFWAGGGITDNVALAEEARAACAVQWLWQAIAIIILLAAAVSTLTTHTDEQPSSVPPSNATDASE